MLDTHDEILRAALSLPPEERAMLSDLLFESVDPPNQKRAVLPGQKRVERRIREIDEGKVETIDGELVMQRLRSRRTR